MDAQPQIPAFLYEIAERLRTQDNHITDNPMFCVQQKRRQHGLDRHWTDETEWILDGEAVEAGTEGAKEYGYHDYWETVMVAFTEQGCKDYLRQNGHNLKKPRIYVESFNRCDEMVQLRKWLIALVPKQEAAK